MHPSIHCNGVHPNWQVILSLRNLCYRGQRTIEIKGIRERLAKTFSLPVRIDIEPLLAGSKRVTHILNPPKKYRSVLI